MKKFAKVIAAAVIAAAVSVSSAVSVSAANANEQRILDALSGTVNLNGVQTKIPAGYFNQTENYLNRSDVELTAAQADEIIKRIDEVKAYLETTNVSAWSELSDEQIEKVVQMSNHVVDVIDIKLKYVKGGTIGKNVEVVKITDDNQGGKKEESVGDNSNPIKQTGFGVGTTVAVAGVGVLLITAAGVYLIRTTKKEKVVE